MNRAARRALSRRELLRRSGALVAIGMTPAMLAACGGDDATTTTSSAAAETTSTTAAEPAAPAASGTIDFLSWEGYDIPDPMKPWKTENSVEIKPTYIANHDEIQTKLKAGGGGGYDLITYYQGYKPLYTELDIIEALDEAKLPNLAGLFPYFAGSEKNFWVDEDGTRTGVPWTWGSIGITYNTEKTSELGSWYDLLDPKFKGKIAMVDDPQGSLALTSKILGYDPGALPKDKLQEVADLLSKFLAQTKGISASFGDMTTKLVSGEAVACYQGWAAMNSFALDAGLKTVLTNVPKEGSFSFCDAYALPPGSDNIDTVLAWINQSLDPVVNARAAEVLVGGVTVEASVAELNETTAALYPYDELDSLLERAPFFNNSPLESDEFVTIQEWNDKWTEIKAGA